PAPKLATIWTTWATSMPRKSTVAPWSRSTPAARWPRHWSVRGANTKDVGQQKGLPATAGSPFRIGDQNAGTRVPQHGLASASLAGCVSGLAHRRARPIAETHRRRDGLHLCGVE